MNVLMICHYGIYQDYVTSYTHNQAKALVNCGAHVRVLIPVAFGKRGINDRYVFPFSKATVVEGVELFYFRHPTLSVVGRKGLNAKLAITALVPLLKKALDGFQPDIIFAHTLGYDSVIGAWLKKKFLCPMVAISIGTDAARPFANGQTAYLKKWCDQADAVIAVSRALKQKLTASHPEKEPLLIHLGYAPHELPDIPRAPFRILQVGHLIPLKRFDVTIRALALLRKDSPEVTLTIVGEGGERANLEALCAQLGLTDAVTFLGKLPNDQVLAQMHASSYYVMVSKPEGFGIVYVEAMSSGCVTVGTEGEGIADVIISGENGFLVPADDPQAIYRVISRCLEEPALVEKIRARAIADASDLTWDANAKKLLTLFQQLIDNAPEAGK